MKKVKYKIVNKRRFTIFVITTMIIAIAIIFMFTKNQKVYSSTYKHAYTELIVKKGDTLWNIAIENMPENYDVRRMIFEIREFNQMENADIYPGDLLKIPIKHNPNE